MLCRLRNSLENLVGGFWRLLGRLVCEEINKLLGRLGETTTPLGNKAKRTHDDFAGKLDNLEGLILDLKGNGGLGGQWRSPRLFRLRV